MPLPAAKWIDRIAIALASILFLRWLWRYFHGPLGPVRLAAPILTFVSEGAISVAHFAIS